MRPANRASRRKRTMKRGSRAAISGAKIFTATGAPRMVCAASHTLAIPPRPSSRTRRYFPKAMPLCGTAHSVVPAGSVFIPVVYHIEGTRAHNELERWENVGDLPCGADTKVHEDTRRRNRRLRRLKPIRGRLPPAGRPVCFTTKNTKDRKEHKGFRQLEDWGLGGVGRCPTPRQGEVLPAPPARPMDVPTSTME